MILGEMRPQLNLVDKRKLATVGKFADNVVRAVVLPQRFLLVSNVRTSPHPPQRLKKIRKNGVENSLDRHKTDDAVLSDHRQCNGHGQKEDGGKDGRCQDGAYCRIGTGGVRILHCEDAVKDLHGCTF